jgi:hypothetical protein
MSNKELVIKLAQVLLKICELKKVVVLRSCVSIGNLLKVNAYHSYHRSIPSHEKQAENKAFL